MSPRLHCHPHLDLTGPLLRLTRVMQYWSQSRNLPSPSIQRLVLDPRQTQISILDQTHSQLLRLGDTWRASYTMAELQVLLKWRPRQSLTIHPFPLLRAWRSVSRTHCAKESGNMMIPKIKIQGLRENVFQRRRPLDPMRRPRPPAP